MILPIILALFTLISSQTPDLDTLQAQITNTHALVDLYQQKLLLLQQLHQHHFPQQPLPQFSASGHHSLSPLRLNPHLTLLKHIKQRTIFMPRQYLLENDQIISCEDYSKKGEFMGDVVLAEEGSITTLVGGKLAMTKISKIDGQIKTEEILLGTKAELLPSVWQRNFNIKDAEDILLQWEHDTLYLRGKETKQLKFQGESILGVYPINQYKAVVVTTQAIHLLNSRSLQLSPPLPAANITRLSQPQSVQIIASCKTETIVVLLSTGQVGRYTNQKIIMSQQLGHLRGQLPLVAQHTSLHYCDDNLFVVDHLSGQIRIFGGNAGKFMFIQGISLPQSQEDESRKKYDVYKVQSSIRLLESSSNNSYIYEIMLPPVQEPYYTSSYLKVLGVIAVAICLIYFKLTRKDSEPSTKAPQPRTVRQQLHQEHQNQLKYASEVEEYLKRQKQKIKKN